MIGVSVRMKKECFLLTACVLGIFLLSSSCSLFVSKSLAAYPEGILFPLEEAARMNYQGEIAGLLLAGNGNLYFSTEEGRIFCLDGEKRESLWTYKLPHAATLPLSLSREHLYAFDEGNTLYCLDEKGQLLWERKGEETPTSPAAEDSGRTYFGTETGGVFALDASNGDVIWRFAASGAVRTKPVFWKNRIIFGCDDGHIYCLDRKGKLDFRFNAGDKIRVTPLVDLDFLFFGADDQSFQCYDLKWKKKKWKVEAGGQVLVSPVAAEKGVFFLGSNTVLHCLNKKNGEIIWWKTVPSRGRYQLETVGERIVISSFSPTLVCFDARTGRETGKYEAGGEVKSNPLWHEPFLLIHLFDYETRTGSLIFLKKQVKVVLSSSLPPPQKSGQEISFTVSSIGFFRPKYEFFLKSGGEEVVVQGESEKSSWVWFPDQEGAFAIGVRVSDGREKGVAEIQFAIVKDLE